MQVALVVYPGVLNDECEAFTSVLSLLSGGEVVTVGTEAGGRYAGPGGVQVASASFDTLPSPDVIVVPGGLGCEHAADDPALRSWLERAAPNARYVASSSTGTVVLASAGLLHGQPASTHWLAADLLRRFGSEQSDDRVAVVGNVVTCEGRISAVDAALHLIHRIDGPAALERARDVLIERGRPHLRTPPRWSLLRRWRRSEPGSALVRPARPVTGARSSAGRNLGTGVDAADPGVVTPVSVLLELVPVDEVRRPTRRPRTPEPRGRRRRSPRRTDR